VLWLNEQKQGQNEPVNEEMELIRLRVKLDSQERPQEEERLQRRKERLQEEELTVSLTDVLPKKWFVKEYPENPQLSYVKEASQNAKQVGENDND